ncbi:MAG: deoxyribose-phosphate aldolase [bacterium]
MITASMIDLTLLKPQAPLGAYTELCRAAVEYNFATVCVNSFHVPLISNLLNAHPTCKSKPCSTIAFPFGTSDIHTKSLEIERAISKGAQEVDVVINISLVKTGEWKRLREELAEIREASDHHVLKMILEVGLLTDEEIRNSSLICLENNVDFLKTSTGINVELAPAKTAEYVAMLKRFTDGTRAQVKASGFIKTLADAELMVAAGASRIGASGAVQIMQELHNKC